jgi:hypothetical protein
MNKQTYELTSVSSAKLSGGSIFVDAFVIEEMVNEIMELMNEDSDAVKCRRLEIVAEDCDGSIYHDYSGRAMYGKECIGITTSKPFKAIELAAQYGITGAKMDSMGLDSIVYWPNIKSVEELSEEEQEAQDYKDQKRCSD